MKQTIICIFIAISFVAYAQEDYTLNINGSEYGISLDKPYDIKINGKTMPVILTMNDILQYEDEAFSFRHSKDYKVSKLKIDEGIEQVMVLSAEGSGVAIQKYSTMDPSMLNEMLLNEVTKESINYGYEMKREDYTRELKSGAELNVLKAVLSYKDDISIYEIASYSGKDEGLIIMTIISSVDLSEQGQKIINLMWDSLVIK